MPEKLTWGLRLIRPAIEVRGCALAACVIGSMYVLPQHAAANPYTPRHDAVVIERLPAFVALRSEAIAKTADGTLAVALATARRYIEVGRAEADPRYYGRATGALQPWWNMTEPPGEVRLLRAAVRQSNHDFDTALADLDAVLADDPDNAQAWLSKAMVLRARGEQKAAAASCARLKRLVEPLLTGACLGSVTALGNSLGNTLRESHRLLATVIDRSKSSASAHRQWAFMVLAELAARLGNQTAAEEHLRSALATGGRSVAVLAAFADLLLDRGEASRVRDLLRGESTADGLLLRLALAERALGNPTWREHTATLRARFMANRARGAGEVHLREEARAGLFLFDEPKRALDLALRNWQLQRESWDARVVLAAALASGRYRAADAVRSWLTREGFEDTRLTALCARLDAS